MNEEKKDAITPTTPASPATPAPEAPATGKSVAKAIAKARKDKAEKMLDALPLMKFLPYTDPKDPGIAITQFGIHFRVKPLTLPDPYQRVLVIIEGLSPIVGPCAPNLNAWLAMIEARFNKGLIDKVVYERLQAEARGKQVERMLSDKNGDAAGKIATEFVQASLNTFARDSGGNLGLQSYAMRAAIRECCGQRQLWKENPGLRERFVHGTGVWPLFIRLERGDKPITEADETHVEFYDAEADKIVSQPVHVWAGGAKQHSISQFEVVTPPWRARFVVEFDKNSPFKPEMVADALTLLPTIGWGAKRSMGYGRCRVVYISEPVSADGPMNLTWDMLQTGTPGVVPIL